jgi:2-polyprenyl-6-methoxyphenol hydroxylase-like FAD-dependent oxidoreductase
VAEARTATVVGGGVAGLASAVSLSQAGWQVTVLERAPEFGEVGAGLAITGNGASTALEDGVCVGRLIGAPVRDGADLGSALSAFDQARRPRCQKIARLAVITARFGCDLGGGWRQSVRNAMLRLAPPKILVRAGTQVVDWTPP